MASLCRHRARVIIDPGCRLPVPRRVFDTAEAATLIVCGEHAPSYPHQVETVRLPDGPHGLALGPLRARLRERGLRRLFVEGGGITVSRLLHAGLLDRLQITVAPILVGGGIAATHLPAVGSMSAAWRPPSRSFRMGEDVLFEFDLRRAG